MTKIFNFALKIKGLVGRVAHAKSSDPAIPPKFGTCTGLSLSNNVRHVMLLFTFWPACLTSIILIN